MPRKLRRMLDAGLYLALHRGFYPGWCSICDKRTIFCELGEWQRENLRCIRCGSIPRWRALISALELHFPGWRKLHMHESSPSGAASKKLARECLHYTPTHYFPETPLGETKDGFRCEDLEKQTFPRGSFDLVVTQDVFEHILEPARAFAEVSRTLRPGGAHVFTVPWYPWRESVVRVIRERKKLQHLRDPEYHRNPVDPAGSLVVTEWGRDLCDFIYSCSGLETTVVRGGDRRRGIDEASVVFISKKMALGSQQTEAAV